MQLRTGMDALQTRSCAVEEDGICGCVSRETSAAASLCSASHRLTLADNAAIIEP